MPPVRGRKRSIARHFYLELTFSRPDIKPSDFSVNSFAWDDTDVSLSEPQSGASSSTSTTIPISRDSTIPPNIYITLPESVDPVASSSGGLSPSSGYDPYGRRKRIKIESGDDTVTTPVSAGSSDLLRGGNSDDYLFSKIDSLDVSKAAVDAGQIGGDADVMNLNPLSGNHRNIMMSSNIVSPHPISYDQQNQPLQQQQQQQPQQQQQQKQHPSMISSHPSPIDTRPLDLPLPQRQYQNPMWTTNMQNLTTINTSNLENIESFNNPPHLSGYGQGHQQSPLISSLPPIPSLHQTHEQYAEASTPPPPPLPPPPKHAPSSSSQSAQVPGSTTFFYCLLCKHIYSSNNRNNNMNRHFYDNHLRTQGRQLREYLLNLADELQQKENTDLNRLERDSGR